MSEDLRHRNNDLQELAFDMAADASTQPIDAHPRYSLSKGNSLDFFLKPPESGQIERFLVSKESLEAQQIYAQLKQSGVPQFTRRHIGDQVVVYSLSTQIKPLSHEQFFGDEQSSETHISDAELFTEFGALWSAVYKGSKRLPATDPIDATAIQSVASSEALLCPVPPYENWKKILSNEEAKSVFIYQTEEELTQLHPDLNKKQISTIMTAVQRGWDQ